MIAFQASSRLCDQKILVAGVARDCENAIRGDVSRIYESLRKCKGVSWFVVESDSSDKTVDVLRSLEDDIPGFRFLSLGSLKQAMPFRTQRLAHCRNAYLNELNSNPLHVDIDYLVVADLDGVNNLVTADGFASCWARSEWGVCTSNQRGPYSDIWALRHPLWSPNDCYRQRDFFLAHNVRKMTAMWGALHSRMITIDTMSDWIEVDSAFGGLAIYRRQALEGVRYVGLDEAGREVCEHVSINNQIRSNGHRIFINPQLVNTSRTEHIRQQALMPRLKRYLLNYAIQKLVGVRATR